MSHQEFAQLLGNYGEFVGAIAVVATLLYVGLQLKQNTRALQSATMQSLFEATNDVWQTNCRDLAQTEQFVELSRRDSRTEGEALFFNSWAILTFRAQENIYYQRQLGAADERFVSLEKRIQGSMDIPYLRTAWQEGFVQSFLSDEYVEFVVRVTGIRAAG